MREKLILALAMVVVGAYAYWHFGPVQLFKAGVAENLYQNRLVAAEEKHNQAKNLLQNDIETVKSGGGEGSGEMLKALGEEEKSLAAAEKARKFEANLVLPKEYEKILVLARDADNLRQQAFGTWEKAVTTWNRMRLLVAQFEAARKQINEALAAWKTEGVTSENIDKLKQSLAEIEALRQSVDELAKEDALTGDLVIFFNQAFADFEQMRKSIAAFEANRPEEGGKLASGLARSVKGAEAVDSGRLLSDWIEQKLTPAIVQSEKIYEQEKLARVKLELLKDQVKESSKGEVPSI